MFGLVQKAFATITTFFNLSYVNSLECVSMSNPEGKAKPKIIDVNNNEPFFSLLVLKRINAAEVAIISTIHMLNCVFLTLLKT